MHTLINGIEVFLQGDSAAQPIIFIHGFPFDHTLLKEKILTFDPIGVKGGLIAMISRTDTTNSLEQTPPTLLIGASDDAIIAPKIMKEIAYKMKNSHYVELQDSGHVSMLEKPQEFVKALKSFLINN